MLVSVATSCARRMALWQTTFVAAFIQGRDGGEPGRDVSVGLQFLKYGLAYHAVAEVDDS